MSAKAVGSFKLRVQAPCSQPWGSMAGDDRARHCTRCQLRVHNLSGMSKDEALKLLSGPDEQVCVRFNVRGDGTAVIGRESWVRRSLRVVRFAALTVWFWVTVVLVQFPWLALSRRTVSAPAPSPSQRQHAARKSEELKAELLAREIARERARELAAIKGGGPIGVSMGAPSSSDRDSIRAEVRRRQHAKKK